MTRGLHSALARTACAAGYVPCRKPISALPHLVHDTTGPSKQHSMQGVSGGWSIALAHARQVRRTAGAAGTLLELGPTLRPDLAAGPHLVNGTSHLKEQGGGSGVDRNLFSTRAHAAIRLSSTHRCRQDTPCYRPDVAAHTRSRSGRPPHRSRHYPWPKSLLRQGLGLRTLPHHTTRN